MKIPTFAVICSLAVFVVAVYAMTTLFHFGNDNGARRIDTREPKITVGCTAASFDASYTGWPFTVVSETTGPCVEPEEAHVTYPVGILLNALIAAALGLVTFTTITITKRMRS
jgi:hypothetical protein